MEDKSMVKDATNRSIVYLIHIVFVVVPVMLLSAFWMWKGHDLRRLIAKVSANETLQAKLLA
jgi:hypothetical protein